MKRSWARPWPALLASALLAFTLVEAAAKSCCDPKSPFREGEGWAAQPATCENVAEWAARAPATQDRITFAIRGKLAEVHFNGVLAYLIMCDAAGMQVMCVTYQTNGMKAGDVVSFGGGYQRAGKSRVILDPCLASRD